MGNATLYTDVMAELKLRGGPGEHTQPFYQPSVLKRLRKGSDDQ